MSMCALPKAHAFTVTYLLKRFKYQQIQLCVSKFIKHSPGNFILFLSSYKKKLVVFDPASPKYIKNMANPKEGAIIKIGNEEASKMLVSILEELEIPLGILPVEDVTEVGFVKSTGYIWIMQKKKVEHYFKTIKQYVRYDTEISGYMEKKKLKKFTGVKGKEFMLWLAVSDVSVDEPTPGKIQFTSQLAGITKSFPKEAFVPAQPEAKPVVQPEVKPVVQSEAKPVAQPLAKPMV